MGDWFLTGRRGATSTTKGLYLFFFYHSRTGEGPGSCRGQNIYSRAEGRRTRDCWPFPRGRCWRNRVPRRRWEARDVKAIVVEGGQADAGHFTAAGLLDWAAGGNGSGRLTKCRKYRFRTSPRPCRPRNPTGQIPLKARKLRPRPLLGATKTTARCVKNGRTEGRATRPPAGRGSLFVRVVSWRGPPPATDHHLVVAGGLLKSAGVRVKRRTWSGGAGACREGGCSPGLRAEAPQFTAKRCWACVAGRRRGVRSPVLRCARACPSCSVGRWTWLSA